MMQCAAEGHEIVALANLRPKHKDELDSYMYQSVGHHMIDLYAEAMSLPLYRRTIEGTSQEVGRDYTTNPNDEVEDLYQLLKSVKEEMEVEAVSVGAILSNYQRVRVEHVCSRLGLTPLAYLWRREQEALLDEMIKSKVTAIIIKVAAMGLMPDKHLGKTLSEMQDYLLKMNRDFELNVCGEGGEFETFTLDCPLFQKKIVIDKTESVLHSRDAFAPVGYLNLLEGHLEVKPGVTPVSLRERVSGLPMKRGSMLHDDLHLDPTGGPAELATDRDTQSPETDDSIQADLSWCVRCTGDDLWVSGVALRSCHDDDIQTLTAATMTRLWELVVGCGSDWDMSCIVLVHLYVHSMADFAAINTVYKTFFGLNPAARVCVQPTLPNNVALQIDCYGYRHHGDRETMHVQGLSHWAPANIGPYSQAVKINQRVYVAGQIGMCPSDLSIIPGGVLAEARLSLRHVTRVLSAVVPGVTIAHIISCVCYVTNHSYLPCAKQEWLNARTSEESEAMPCSVQYVVVPRLPKSAAIEWQVTATKYTSQQLTEYRETGRTSQVDVCSRCLCDDNRVLICATAAVYLLESRDRKELDLAETLQAFVACYKNLLAKTKSSLKDVPLMRVFYPAAKLKYQDLYQGLSALLDGVPVSLVPVEGLETDSMVFCVSQ